ncbi:MAG: NAD(P)H-dependent oxidoreductase subunit E [Anaerolineales bacterium]|nr:MAG: NAD(P)H-dependent oxidoreductase subunit E [Anaerolineales bacterium]
MGVTEGDDFDPALMDEVFESYERQKGALIPVLQKAQHIYGYLPPEVLQLIADQLGLSLSRVYGVATFYAQFYLERRGKHILKLCDGTACHVKGTPLLLTAVEDGFEIQPGETTKDGELTAEVVYCLGSCAMAPVAVLDEQVMGRMRPEMLVRQVKKHMASSRKETEA